MFNFQRKGQFFISKEEVSEDKLMEVALDGGAEDVKTDGADFEVICDITDYYNLEQVLSAANIKCLTSELAYIPNSIVPLSDKEVANKVIKTIDQLEALDDVKNVYANFEIDDSIEIEE